MAFNHFLQLQKIFIFTLLLSFVLFQTTIAYAGFEWVPPKKEEPVPFVVSPKEETAPSVAPVSSQQGYDVLPLAPMPLIEEENINRVVPASSELPQDATASQKPVLKVKTMISSDDQTFKAESPRVIMSDDAPEAAINNVPGSERLTIKAFPDQKDAEPVQLDSMSQRIPDAVVSKSEEASSPDLYKEAVGFGSDVPLVLALQQVVPPEYAFSFGRNVNPGVHVSWNGGKPWNIVISEMLAPLNMIAEIKGGIVHIRYENMSKIENTENKRPSAQMKRIHVIDPGEASQKQPLETIKKIESMS